MESEYYECLKRCAVGENGRMGTLEEELQKIYDSEIRVDSGYLRGGAVLQLSDDGTREARCPASRQIAIWNSPAMKWSWQTI